MAKLYFRYGSMGSSKTANALMVKYNYEEKGQKVCLIKPEIDTRDIENLVKSRIGIESESYILLRDQSPMEIVSNSNPNCVIIDEAQFLSRDQVLDLCDIVDDHGIPVICYGLRADFTGQLFSGSQALFVLADSIEEIKTICFCGKKAIMNMRLEDGIPIFEGDQVKIGGNESYISVCRSHWKSGKYFSPNA